MIDSESQPPQPAQPPPASWLVRAAVVSALLLLMAAGIVGLLQVTGVTDLRAILGGAEPAPNVTTAAPDETTRVETIVPAGEGARGLSVGQGVEFSDGINRWTLSIVGVEWFDGGCDQTLEVTTPVIVLDVWIEVLAGVASVNHLLELEYLDESGTPADISLLSHCDRPALTDTFDIPAGSVRTGKVAFEVPAAAGGELVYTVLFGPVLGAWTIPPAGSVPAEPVPTTTG